MRSFTSLFQPICSGAFSNVYKAIDKRSNKKVAIKCVRKFELNHSQVRPAPSDSLFVLPSSIFPSHLSLSMQRRSREVHAYSCRGVSERSKASKQMRQNYFPSTVSFPYFSCSICRTVQIANVCDVLYLCLRYRTRAGCQSQDKPQCAHQDNQATHVTPVPSSPTFPHKCAKEGTEC